MEIEKDQASAYEAAARGADVEVQFVDIKRFDGGPAIVAIVIPVLGTALHFVEKIVIEQIRSKKHVVVKANGVEIRGLDGKNASKVLSQLLEKK